MFLPSRTFEFVLIGLEASPVSIENLVHRYRDTADWDSADPDLFSPRESIAHLADWERVHRERVRQCLSEDLPSLWNPDVDELAKANRYDLRSPEESVGWFARERSETLALFRQLKPEVLDRRGVHPRLGELTIEGIILHAYAHDGFHLRRLQTELG